MEDSMIVREFYATRRDGVDLYHTYTYIETDKRVQDVVGIENYTELRG